MAPAISPQSQHTVLAQLSAQDRARLTQGPSTNAAAAEIAARLHHSPAGKGLGLQELTRLLLDREAVLASALKANDAGHSASSKPFVAQQGFTRVDQRTVQGNTVFGARLSSTTPVGTPSNSASVARAIATAQAQAAKKPRDANAPSGDILKAPVDKLWKDLHAPELLKKVAADPYLKMLHRQTVTNLKHVRLDFEITTDKYVHDYVLQGPLPFAPTLGAMAQTRTFFQALEADGTAKVDVTMTPGQIQAELQQLEESHKAFMKGIIDDPLPAYKGMSARLRTEGENAKFPEFKDLIRYLELFVIREEVCQAADNNPHLALLQKAALDELKAIQAGGHPYRKTIDAVENCLGFLDVFERGKPDSTASPELYHSHRYQYYTHFLKAQTPEHVMFPTFYGLGATDLLKTRGVPIGFVGVPPEVTWVDGFSQSPLEFWYHDVNHTRRMFQFFNEHAEKLGISPEKLAERSTAFIKDELMPLLKINKTDSDEVKNTKRMMKLVAFEILHEDAMPADKDVFKDSLMRAPNTITPFEQLVNDESKVEYVMEPGATTLAYVYRKAAGSFYDMPGMRMETICGANFRTQEFVAKSAKALAEGLSLDVPHHLIDAYARDDTGMPDDFRRQLEKQLDEDPSRMAPLSTAGAARGA